MKKNKSDRKYFNFPIPLLKGFLNNPDDTYSGISNNECLQNIISYAVCAEASKYTDLKTPTDKLQQAEKYFGISLNTGYTRYYKDGRDLYYEFNGNPMTGISREVFFDFLKNDKTQWEKIQLLAFLAIKSIIGNQVYKKTTIKFLLSRMDGRAKQVEDFGCLSMSLLNHNLCKEYQFKKLINSLMDNWNLKYYSRHTRGFYVSFDMEYEDLVYIAEKRKLISNKQRKIKKDEAYQKAMARLG